MSSDVLFAKLLSRHIWDEYSVIVTYEDILSLTSPISEEHKKLVDLSIPWLEDIASHLTIYDKPLNPNGIYATLKEWLKRFGTFVQIDDHREDYVELDPEIYKVALWDHVG